MEYLPCEIILLIMDECDFLSKIRLNGINQFFNEIIQILDLMNIPKVFSTKLNNEILEQRKFKILKFTGLSNYLLCKNLKSLNK